MAVPVEKLNMMLEELMKKSKESAEAMNIISLEEYKNLNADKIAYLNYLKKFVLGFNKKGHLLLKIYICEEIRYLLSIYLQDNEIQNILKKDLEETNELIFIINIILNDIKSYPSPRLKKNTLKFDNKVHKNFLQAKNRLANIQQEIEEYDFAPQDYMKDALDNIEFLIDKAHEYENDPEAFLMMLEYYYSSDDDLEWTDEDREFVAKYYA